MKYDEIMILVDRFYDCKHKLNEIGKCRIVDVVKCKGFDFKTYLNVSKLFDRELNDGTCMYYFDLYKAIGAFYEANIREIWLELYNKGLIM